MNIAAKYEDGVFKPLENVAMENGTLVEVHVPSPGDRFLRKPGSVRELTFYGMWKDRTDIGDSVDFVNALRSEPRR